jgi:hypothetical protein
MSFMERVAPVVDDTIRALAQKKFIEDPVAGKHYSRSTSIVSSAYKRHGRILEVALRESLRESNRHKVWHDSAFRVSMEADALANTQELEACRQTTLPYGSSVRTLRDALAEFNPRDMIDVQGFCWGVFNRNKIWFGGKSYHGTRDMLPEFMARQVYAVGFGRRDEIAALSKKMFHP